MIILYTDGGCRPKNPGGYGCWAWIAHDDQGRELASAYGCLGPGMTSNQAEYEAILQALIWAQRHGFAPVVLYADSRLAVEQIRGTWQAKAPHLVPLVREARRRLKSVDGRIEWVPRESNARADTLAERAYLEAAGGRTARPCRPQTRG
jgi:ribonuclease HI